MGVNFLEKGEIILGGGTPNKIKDLLSSTPNSMNVYMETPDYSQAIA